jgi:hypothetical protein
MGQTSSQGAYFYRSDGSEAGGRLAVWVGLPPQSAKRGENGATPVGWSQAPGTAVVLQEGAWSDPRFRELPEFLNHRFEGVVSVPVVEAGQAIGTVNFCRTRRVPLLPRDFTLLLNLGVPLGNLVAGGEARRRLQADLDRAWQELEDRKLLERAKGLLQARQGWTEERAYFHIRRLSRSQRLPMREVASRVIATAGLQLVQPPALPANGEGK